jgi:adenylate kinase family enzyme
VRSPTPLAAAAHPGYGSMLCQWQHTQWLVVYTLVSSDSQRMLSSGALVVCSDTQVLQQRLASGQQSGEPGFILDGFPRWVTESRAGAGNAQLVLQHLSAPRQEQPQRQEEEQEEL